MAPTGPLHMASKPQRRKKARDSKSTVSGEIRGRVVDEKGDAVSDGMAQLYYQDSRHRLLGRLDSHGEFAFTKVPLGRHRVYVVSPIWGVAEKIIVVSGATPVVDTFQLQPLPSRPASDYSRRTIQLPQAWRRVRLTIT